MIIGPGRKGTHQDRFIFKDLRQVLVRGLQHIGIRDFRKAGLRTNEMDEKLSVGIQGDEGHKLAGHAEVWYCTNIELFDYEDARKRLFAMSFDPYQCVEHRWGDAEAATCIDAPIKRAWYDGEQTLRNQLERTYDAQMDFTLKELAAKKPGVATPPDTDARAYLLSAGAQAESAP